MGVKFNPFTGSFDLVGEPSSGGDVASDSIWSAKGDIAAATGNDTAQVVPVGTNGQVLVADDASDAGVSWQDVEGTGDMLKTTYDPQNIAGDAFNADNHTDGTTNKVYTATEKSKLAGIATGAEVNVQADWNAGSGDAQILNKPTLGTAAASDTGDFATAAQGATADTAVQPGDLAAVATSGSYADLVGAPSIPSTFDDLSDGTTNKAYTNTEKMKLAGVEAGADVTDATNVAAAGAVMTTGNQSIAGSKTFTDNVTTLGKLLLINAATGNPEFDFQEAGTTRAKTYYDVTNNRLTFQNNENNNADALYFADHATFTGNITLAGTVDGRDISVDGSKLDGIETGADVTDAANVDAAGAVMNTDTSTASMGFVVDEDDMASDSATKVPTQQSVKAYVDGSTGTEIIDAEKAGQPGTLFAFGDSITAGTGASDANHRYINLLADYKGWTLTNNAVSGSQISDPTQIDMLYDTTITADMNIVTLAGANDMRTSEDNVALQRTYRDSLLAALAYCAIPDTYKIWAPDMTDTGTWVASPSVSNGKGLKSSTNGSTLTATVKGDTIYLGYVVSPNYDGTFTVTIDGVSKGTFGTTASVPTRTVDSGEWANVALRFTGLSDEPHTVVITVTSATGSTHSVWIDWIAGNGIPYEITGPNVWVGNCCRMTSGGYSTWGGSDTLVAVWNNMIREVCEALASDGLNVLLVETTDALDPATGLDTDGLHPNDTGHQQIADAFAAKMSSFSKPYDKAQANRGMTWVDAYYTSGWEDYDTGLSTGYGGAKYFRDASGMVHLKGTAKNTSGGTKAVGSVIFSLPPGYRPSAIQRFAAIVSNADVNTAVAVVDVHPDGRVVNSQAAVGNGRFIVLSGVHFRAEQ